MTAPPLRRSPPCDSSWDSLCAAVSSSAGAGIPGPWKRCEECERRDGVSSRAAVLAEPLLPEVWAWLR